jgi:tetratricopeptide (TPR) repeat protein
MPDGGPFHYHPRHDEAAAAMTEDRLDIAERLLKPHLKEDPFDVRAIRMLAELAARIGRLRDSEKLLRRAVELAPGWTAARANLALVLGRLGRPAEALEMIDEIFQAEPDWVGHWNLKAATLGRLGDFDEAIALYERVIAKAPRQPRVWLSYGHMLKTIGRLDDGIAAYRKAIEIKPALGEAWWSLANLKTVRFEPADVTAMLAALDEPATADEDRIHLHFALGKALHDSADFDRAFEHYSAGNALRRRYHPYRRESVTRLVDKSIELFTGELLRSRGGSESGDPIFIVGLPRSGSTLIEQILSSHSQVEGTGELPDLPAIAREGSYPDWAIALSAAERKRRGEEYLRRASVQRRTQRPFFIDKLPNNWMFVPFIQLILPNARIIDARRHPMGCCLSNFRQHFARGQDFTYDLADLGHYYSDYVRLMAHVDALLPGRVHRIVYERMVEDSEREIRALLDHCGLDFEPACLEFHRTERAVRTPSSEQVRQPIYRAAADEWTQYEAHLVPLRDSLAELVADDPAAPAASLQR